jgi:hypothetical protein
LHPIFTCASIARILKLNGHSLAEGHQGQGREASDRGRQHGVYVRRGQSAQPAHPAVLRDVRRIDQTAPVVFSMDTVDVGSDIGRPVARQ